MNKKFLGKVLIIGFLVSLTAIPSVFSKTGDKPVWAKKGNYLIYKTNMKFIKENPITKENITYVGSGEVKYEVENTYENFAQIGIDTEVDWKDNMSVPGFSGDRLESWKYSIGTVFYLSEERFENLKGGELSEGWEKVYKGIKEIDVPYGKIETLNLSASMKNGPYSYFNNTYYDSKSGTMIKSFLESESPNEGYSRYEYSLEDTNIKVSKSGNLLKFSRFQTLIAILISANVLLVIAIIKKYK